MENNLNTENVDQEMMEQQFASSFSVKSRAFVGLLKMRLTFLVAASAVFGLAIAGAGTASWTQLVMVGLGAFLVTGASNALNQIMERDLDGLMDRTKSRPLPQKQLSVREAWVFALAMAVAGISVMGAFFNLPAALFSVIAVLLYAFVYTPFKRLSPICVFIGAIPGALPPLIGWVALTGELSQGALILFAFQFFWQFPHFWAIAWTLDEDYQKAGFKMMPTSEGKSKFAAWIMLVYALCLVPLAFLPFATGMITMLGAVLLAILGLSFSWPAFKLIKKLEDKYAKQLMFASFLYLPLSLTILLVA